MKNSDLCWARGGASFCDERVGAERGQESEEVKNREGVASGRAAYFVRVFSICVGLMVSFSLSSCGTYSKLKMPKTTSSSQAG